MSQFGKRNIDICGMYHLNVSAACTSNKWIENLLSCFFFSLFFHPDYEIVSPYEVTHQGQYISHEVAHHHRRRRRSLTPDASSTDQTVHFRLNGLGQEFHMELREASDGLIAPGFTIQVLGKNGTKSLRAYQKHDLCFYQGSLRSRVNSSVALSTCTGMVSLNTHRIELLLWSLSFCYITAGEWEVNVAQRGQVKTVRRRRRRKHIRGNSSFFTLALRFLPEVRLICGWCCVETLLCTFTYISYRKVVCLPRQQRKSPKINITPDDLAWFWSWFIHQHLPHPFLSVCLKVKSVVKLDKERFPGFTG